MRSAPLLMAAAALAAPWAAPLSAEESLYFSRNFPGSVPAYFEVTVDRSGKAVYREAPDDEFPVEFALEEAETKRLFELAAQLDFSKPLNAKRKVAFTGDKVFRRRGADGSVEEAQYIYTEDETATELTTWFLKVADTERQFIELERVLQFDRLGVNDALLNLHQLFDRDRVVGQRQFLPLLEKIVAQKRIVHVARARASALIERIHGIGPEANR